MNKQERSQVTAIQIQGEYRKLQQIRKGGDPFNFAWVGIVLMAVGGFGASAYPQFGFVALIGIVVWAYGRFSPPKHIAHRDQYYTIRRMASQNQNVLLELLLSSKLESDGMLDLITICIGSHGNLVSKLFMARLREHRNELLPEVVVYLDWLEEVHNR